MGGGNLSAESSLIYKLLVNLEQESGPSASPHVLGGISFLRCSIWELRRHILWRIIDWRIQLWFVFSSPSFYGMDGSFQWSAYTIIYCFENGLSSPHYDCTYATIEGQLWWPKPFKIKIINFLRGKKIVINNIRNGIESLQLKAITESSKIASHLHKPRWKFNLTKIKSSSSHS